MSKTSTNSNKGFTIIEVLIVLAIAGLILLIVFLAVPALQRNSRNTQYKNDAAALIGAATEFSNNSQGAIPVTANETAIKDLAKTRSITDLKILTGAGSDSPDFQKAILRTGVRCGAPSADLKSYTTASSAGRALTLVYAVENSKGEVVAQCTES